MFYLNESDIKNNIHYYIMDCDDPKERFDNLFNWFIFIMHKYVDNDKSVVVSKEG